MKFNSALHKYIFLTGLLWAVTLTVSAQSVYQPYSYQFYQKLNSDLYSTKVRLHTSIKPMFVDDSLLRRSYDSLMNYGSGNKTQSSFANKLFNEHLVDVKSANSTFYADLLPDFTIGRDFSANKNLYQTSLGLQIGGTVSNKFSYYVSGYASNAKFPDYIDSYINQTGVVPGQAKANLNSADTYNWTEVRALVSYTPVKYLNIAAGHDKNFFGDGYRSLILSDFASPYFFFKLTGTLGDVRYVAMWTYMNDPAKTSQYGVDRNKFGVFHYLDWNVNNRLSVGLFENITGYFTDDKGQKRPFDFYYANPIIFMKPINNSSNDPDKSLLGLTAKYKLSDGVTAYGQFALNEFHASDFFSSNGAFDNKYAFQLGLRGANLLGVQKLNFLVETNNAKPYTYQARTSIENYSSNSEPLAHPFGANFREFLGILNYSIGRFDLQGQLNYAFYGLDANNVNYGKNIFKLYTSPASLYGNFTGQGVRTDLYYSEAKVAYLINPKYNLRLELGGVFRDEKNAIFNNKTTMLTFGLRSSFRSIYHDF
jgi:hypothetical protein